MERRTTDICPDLATAVFSHVREGIVIAEHDGKIAGVNEAFTRITGYGHNELLEQSLGTQGAERRLSVFHAAMKQAVSWQGHWVGEACCYHQDGRELSLQLSVSVVYGSGGEIRHFVVLVSDISHLKKRQQQLERSAHYDALTQLPNRLLLNERMHQAMESARTHRHSLAVAFIDLDGFKAVNDNYGHDVGDRVLQIIAQRIKAATREDDVLARFGGDEFVAGLVGLQQPHDCEPVLKRMLQAASAPISVEGRSFQLSASIGVAFFPNDGQEIETLIRKADQAMYLSKRSGGSCLVRCAA
ncbi:MAG: diguanylate cyclase domain-containing protein [Pseudomonas sp.]